MLRPLSAMFGISGVGKTYMAHAACRKFPSLIHAEAGALLSVELSKSREELRTSSKGSIESNQRRLISAIQDLRSRFPAQPMLFDGHIFIDNGRELVPVPLEIFKDIDPTVFIWIYDDAEEILKRRRTDPRSRPLLSTIEIDRQQQFGRDLCTSYASSLKIDFAEVRSGQLTAFFRALSDDRKDVTK
jgi:adenylate kinase